MATYVLYTASYGSSYANDKVKIFDQNNNPAIVMASASGGLLSREGVATLDGSGNLSVYLDNSITPRVDLFPLNLPTASSSNTQESTQLLVKTAVQTIATNTAGGGGGSATSAKQDTGNTSLASIDGKTPALGVIASGAKQDTGNTSLASIDTKFPAKGQAAMAASTPVVLASDQAAIPVTPAALATGTNTIGNVKLIDSAGTNVGTIKAASTAAVATDTSVVVAVSPNTPVQTLVPADIFVTATTISAQNLNPTSGTATANSTISVALSGQNFVALCITTNTLGATAAFQVTYDNSTWKTIYPYTQPDSNPPQLYQLGGVNSTNTGNYLIPVSGAKGFRLSANSATVSGTIVATLNATAGAASTVQGVSLASVGAGGVTATMGAAGGTATAALGVFTASAGTTTDYSAQAWAATSGNGATITDSGGAVASFDVNLTAFTAGSSTGLDIFLQWSPDAGTTWYDLWQCEALTAVGHIFIPPLVIPGARRRMRWVNRGGAATTATVTVTTNRLSVAPAKTVRQWFDRTAGVLSGTTTSVTAWYDVAGCTFVAAYIPVGVATGPATYQLQFSADGVNVLPASGTAVAAVASATTPYVATAGLTGRFARLAVIVAATSQTAATAPVVITGA